MTESGATVLVVDDDESIRETMRLALETRGYRVLTANNGADALAVLRENMLGLPRLILLDLMMPTMDGWTFMSVVDADPLLRAIPIVVVTAYTTEAPRLGRRPMLAKPVSLDALYETVDRYCRVTAPSVDASRRMAKAAPHS